MRPPRAISARRRNACTARPPNRRTSSSSCCRRNPKGGPPTMNQRRMLVMAKISALSAALLLAAQGVARAQTGTVSGTVIHEATQRPLGGVQVGVAGVAGRGAVTDGNGRFTIAGLSGETVVLSVRYI